MNSYNLPLGGTFGSADDFDSALADSPLPSLANASKCPQLVGFWNSISVFSVSSLMSSAISAANLARSGTLSDSALAQFSCTPLRTQPDELLNHQQQS